MAFQLSFFQYVAELILTNANSRDWAVEHCLVAPVSFAIFRIELVQSPTGKHIITVNTASFTLLGIHQFSISLEVEWFRDVCQLV